jgi:hypothetical protein
LSICFIRLAPADPENAGAPRRRPKRGGRGGGAVRGEVAGAAVPDAAAETALRTPPPAGEAGDDFVVPRDA